MLVQDPLESTHWRRRKKQKNAANVVRLSQQVVLFTTHTSSHEGQVKVDK